MGRFVFKLPDVGEGTAEAELVGWHVKVGDVVEVGQVLGIVEVMKLMNNIEAKVAGTVKEILVDNEDAVEHGQPIMVIQPK